jgi:hypothetical protein
MKLRLGYVLLCVLGAACGDSGDDEDGGVPTETLSCEVIQDPENCWADAAADVAACVPAGEVGVLAPDRASCTFSDGSRVVFDQPMPEFDTGFIDFESLGITFEKNGSTCARFVDTFQNRMELEAGDKAAVSELHAGGDFHLHCEGGPSYATDFSTMLTECGTGPTDGFSVEPVVEFRIVSVATPDPIFQCAP